LTNQEKLDRIFLDMSDKYQRLNATQQTFAVKELERVRSEVIALLAEYSGDDGTIKRQRLNRLLRDLKDVEAWIRENGMDVMEKVISESAEFTTATITGALGTTVGSAAIAGVVVDKVNADTLRYVINRFGDDGLVLSDRVWNTAGDYRDEISKALRSGIIRGESVNGMIARVRKVHDNETWKIRRLVVTEGNVANRAATGYNAQASDVVEALQIVDRPGHNNHRQHKCYELAHADRYGLGEGIYPKDNTEIWSPHPNCTSYVKYVISEAKAETSSNKTVNARPIEQGKSKAIDQIAKDPSILNVKLNQNAGGEDRALKTLLKEQGYDGKGNVVSKNELDKFIANGERELFRGVTEAKFAEQFKDGDLFAGLGTYGNGTYTAYGSSAEAVAQSYAGKKGDIVRMSLKSDAKVVKYDVLLGEMMDYEYVLAEKLAKATSKKAREAIEAETLLIKDFGRFATLRGYDAIDVTGFEYLVVLNRTSLRIQRESHGGGF
jgi:hypothetical protein